MYVGSTGERGLRQLVFEAVDRAVNEVLAGRARTVDVTLTRDGGVRVADDGPGLPVAAAGDTDGPCLEDLLTRMCAGARPGGRHAVDVGPFGMGPCVTNALSSRLTAEVRRQGGPPGPGVRAWRRGRAARCRRGGDRKRHRHRLPADADVFGTARCSFSVLAERFRELAFLNRGLGISLSDERGPNGARSVHARYPGAVREFVAFLDARAETAVHPDIIGIEQDDPLMAGTIEVALRWSSSREGRIRSFANSRPTPEGGTHLAGFRDGVAAAINSRARQRWLLTTADPGLGADRICAGLTAVVSVKLDRPEFHGATCGVLGGAAVRSCVGEAVREHLGTWPARHPEHAGAVIGHVVRGAGAD
ncbi:DNA gyrase subunit B [Streptomyces sp. RB17]|uniref:ATP-binding protein n=1 Tax=Streptomyces sp. RB17 TaxID=2585197 RepID=UPI0013061299|nr:ATP-binding protein [Streptomyces sp. RB17]MQY34555.1 DNA gyrase subunit B [Streptomyces sp. RB17]